MGIKVHRVIDQAHSAVEPGKSIWTTKFHQITGHTAEHLLKPTANYMKLKLIGRMPRVRSVQRRRSDKEIFQRRK